MNRSRGKRPSRTPWPSGHEPLISRRRGASRHECFVNLEVPGWSTGFSRSFPPKGGTPTPETKVDGTLACQIPRTSPACQANGGRSLELRAPISFGCDPDQVVVDVVGFGRGRSQGGRSDRSTQQPARLPDSDLSRTAWDFGHDSRWCATGVPRAGQRKSREAGTVLEIMFVRSLSRVAQTWVTSWARWSRPEAIRVTARLAALR